MSTAFPDDTAAVIDNRKPPGATESTVLGPFHVVDSLARELGADIASGETLGAPWFAVPCAPSTAIP